MVFICHITLDIFMEFSDYLKRLCAMSARYNNVKGAYRASSGEGIYVVRAMEGVAQILTTRLSSSMKNKLKVSISKGNGGLPKILWISILQPGRSPSNSVSVTICFGRMGEGAIGGLMVPRAGGLFNLSPMKRYPGPILVDVDGEKPASRYNNCFINPKEWLVAEFNEVDIFDHLTSSIDVMMDLIRKGQGVN